MRKFALKTLSYVYCGVTTLRNLAYDRGWCKIYVSKIPVVSVGNVTAGGNAKTPLTLSIAKMLSASSFSPVILSRGYGGKIKGPHLVSTADNADQVGDEPVLLSRAGFPVVIARKRAEGARLIEANEIGNIIILDDGFQHRKLHREVDIVTVNVAHSDAVKAFVTGELLPLGRFRERRDQALKRADIIVVSSRSLTLPVIAPEFKAILPDHAECFLSNLYVSNITSLKTGEELVGSKVVALSAIANPEGFYTTLQQNDFEIVEKIALPDHADLPEKLLDDIREHHGEIAIVCTEKDAVKLESWQDKNIYVLRVEARVEPGDIFLNYLLNRIASKAKVSQGFK